MHRLTTAVGSVGRPLASKALQRTFATSPAKTKKQGSRFYSTPATSVVAEPFLNGTSSTYVEEMYESWLENPSSVHKVMAYFCLLSECMYTCLLVCYCHGRENIFSLICVAFFLLSFFSFFSYGQDFLKLMSTVCVCF